MTATLERADVESPPTVGGTPWWIHPLAPILLVSGGTIAYAATRSDDAYALWGTSRAFDSHYAWVAISCVLCLAAGVGLAAAATRGTAEVPVVARAGTTAHLVRAFRVLAVLTLCGYAAWAAVALLRGLSPADVVAVLRSEPGSLARLKAIATPVAGVTTLTQFGPVAVALAVIVNRRFGTRLRWGWLLVLALVRAFFYAERLALLEMIVPAVVAAMLSWRPLTARAARVRACAPVVGLAVVWVVFAGLEYFRSWPAVRETVRSPYATWVTDRLLGYYGTSYNNSAILAGALRGGDSRVPYYSFQSLWQAPGFAHVVGTKTVGVDDVQTWWSSYLAVNGNREFNTVGSFLVVHAELGSVLGAVYWLVCGLLVGLVYRRARRGAIGSGVAYACAFVGLLELPRLIYFAQGRFVPVVIGAIYVAYAEHRADARGMT